MWYYIDPALKVTNVGTPGIMNFSFRYNRQFRYEERNGAGYVKGRYGFFDQLGKLQVNLLIIIQINFCCFYTCLINTCMTLIQNFKFAFDIYWLPNIVYYHCKNFWKCISLQRLVMQCGKLQSSLSINFLTSPIFLLHLWSINGF
jgi:hypothetical protein